MTLRPLVIDMDHADAFSDVSGLKDLADFRKAYEWGIRGIIHKASEGEHYVDPLYHTRKQAALDAGMLWGAYHFMRADDIGRQVAKFLSVVGVSRSPDTRMVLDYEDRNLSLWQAERWLELVHNATGQRPWLYSGFLIRQQTDRRDPGLSIGQYPLWLAEYSDTAKIPRPWKTYVLWQRSGDGQGPEPHNIPGIGHREDVNWFDGSDDDLKAIWLDKGAGVAEVA